MSGALRSVAAYRRSIMLSIFAVLLSLVIAKIRGTSKHQPDLTLRNTPS